MDKSKAIEAIINNVDWIRKTCGVEDWELIIQVVAVMEGSNIGEASPDPRYQSCHILIEAEDHDNEEELLLTTRHEIVHSTLGMINLYANMYEALLGSEDARGLAVMDRAHTFVSEQMTRRLERIFRVNQVPVFAPDTHHPRVQIKYRSSGKLELPPTP